MANADQVWQPVSEYDLGRRAANTFYANGRGNYWSDYVGADRDHNGVGDTPYHETDVFGYLLDRNPNARLFAQSPAVALLRKGEELLPLSRPAACRICIPCCRRRPKRERHELPA